MSTRNHGKLRLAIATLSALIVTGAAAEPTPPTLPAPLTVRIVGLESDRGSVAFALYESAESYEAKSDPTRAEFVSIVDGACTFTVEGLAPGSYALMVYHDKNDNEELDANRMRVPKEPYGFSNNVRGTFGPPKFDRARFELDAGGRTLEIELR